MIAATEALKQIERLSGLDFFPREKPALVELRKAAESAGSPIVLNQALDAWLGEKTVCPKPAELRAMIHGAQERQQKAPRCAVCNGDGFVSEDVLITYEGHSFNVERSARLTGYSQAAVAELRAKLGDNQDIVSAAVPCGCQATGHPIAKSRPMCRRCQDFGFYGGKVGGEYEGPYKWCDCPAGDERRANEPSLVDEANVARRKVMALGVRKLGAEKRTGKMMRVGDLLGGGEAA